MAERFEQPQNAHRQVRQEAAPVAKSLSPMTDFPEVDKLLSRFYTITFYHRRPILAIIGGANWG